MATGGGDTGEGLIPQAPPGAAGDLLRCYVCLDTYKSPRVLPCLHSFCEACLVSHVAVNARAMTPRCRVFACPTCREETPVPEGGPTGFRRDFRVQQLQDYLANTGACAQDGRDSADVTSAGEVCEFCEQEGGGYLLFCRNCDKNMCGACAARHRRKSIFSGHVVSDAGGGADTDDAGDTADDTCPTHRRELLRYICEDCDAPVCGICTLTSHDDHITLAAPVGLRNAVDGLRFQFKCMGARLLQLEARLEETSRREKAVHDSLVQQTTAVKRKVRDVMELAHRAGEELTEEVTSRCQQQLDTLDRRQVDIELSVARMNSLSDLALDLIGRAPGVKLLKSYSDLSSRIDQALGDSHLLNSDIPDVTIKYEPVDCRVYLGRVTSLNPKESPALRPTKERPLLDSSPEVVTTSSIDEPKRPSGLASKARFGRLGNAGGEFDSPRDACFITSSTFVIADTNNDRLQIFDLDGLLIRVIAQGQMKPWGVARTKEGNIAVTDNYEKCIKVFRPDGEFVEKLGKLLCPCGITCNARGEFVVTDFFNTSALVLDRKGAPVRRFEVRSRGQDRHTCGASRVVIGPDGAIVVSDISNCCVKIFTRCGRLVSRVTHPDHMISPQGVATDRHGNVLVADTIKQRILVFNKDGDYVTSLEAPEERMRDVTGLSVSRQGEIVVTLMKSNQIRLYTMIY